MKKKDKLKVKEDIIMNKIKAKKEYPSLYNDGKEMLINIILDYYSTMNDNVIYTKKELEKFDDDRLIVELGFCYTSFNYFKIKEI